LFLLAIADDADEEEKMVLAATVATDPMIMPASAAIAVVVRVMGYDFVAALKWKKIEILEYKDYK
jgi:hypothetical protein